MTSPQNPVSAPARPKRTRVHHLQEMKARGERWPMLTAYDVNTARIFDEAGVPVLLVGDSAGNTVLGYDTTVPVTVEELLILTRAVVRGAPHALVVADLPFGSYQVSVSGGSSGAHHYRSGYYSKTAPGHFTTDYTQASTIHVGP